MSLEIHNLDFAYGERPILKKLNSNFSPGKFYGIIGPNGSGKTTFLKLIARLLDTPVMSVRLFNLDITKIKAKALAKDIAYVPQMFNVEQAFSVRELIAMGRYPYQKALREPSEEDHKAIEDAIEKTNLTELQARPVSDLSGGELQRVLLARAIAQNTTHILLDEPLSHLDIHHQVEMLNLIRNLCKVYNRTVISVLHDLNLAIKYCDNLLLLKDGGIFAQGEAGEVLTSQNIEKVYHIKAEIVEWKNQKSIIFGNSISQ